MRRFFRRLFGLFRRQPEQAHPRIIDMRVAFALMGRRAANQ